VVGSLAASSLLYDFGAHVALPITQARTEHLQEQDSAQLPIISLFAMHARQPDSLCYSGVGRCF
jgi:hypothetical protein